MIITGGGFTPGGYYDVVVIRPDGSIVQGDGTFTCPLDSLGCWNTILADELGAFTYDYILNGIEGLYSVEVYPWPWGGPGSGEMPVATTTFTDSQEDYAPRRLPDVL